MTDVAIVGGGLAGMTAALRLLQRGCHVTLYEASTRLGGKAGANLINDEYVDHGYHIFPLWYLNAWCIIDELNIRSNFADHNDFDQLAAGEFPRFQVLRGVTSPRYALRNMFSGYMSPSEMFLLYYSAIDLMSQHYKRRSYLDQVSLIGFLRSTFYRTETIAVQTQQLILKGISVPSYFVSAMTMRKVLLFWMSYPLPWYRMARGNLQEFWITPIQRKLEQLGCVIRTGQYLERIEVVGPRVTRLHFKDQNDQSKTYSVEIDRVILAIPPEQVNKLVGDEVYATAPTLANIRYLQSQPMAALNVNLNRRIPGIPSDIVNLVDSKFGLSFIDLSQNWQGYDTTVLNMIASDITPLEGLSADDAITQLLEEIKRFIPEVTTTTIRSTNFQSHIDQPLFMNDVGVWAYRPDPTKATELVNLYLAGDYCRSHIDLTCMEGAITTGLHAAESVRRDAGLSGPPIEILQPDISAQWLRKAIKITLLPGAALAKGITLTTEPSASEDTQRPIVGVREATKHGQLTRKRRGCNLWRILMGHRYK
jgi:zeta-carotene desaturase